MTGRLYPRCQAPGCIETPRRFSRFCNKHFRVMERTRSLKGRVLTRSEYRNHTTLAAEFLRSRAEHPAVQAAVEYMAALIAEKPRAGFLHSEFARLRAKGATAEELLAAVLGLFGWQEYNPTALDDACFDLNLGQAVLRVASGNKRVSKEGKTYYVYAKGRHAEALGRHLREDLGAFALLVWKTIQADIERPDKARKALRVELEKAYKEGKL